MDSKECLNIVSCPLYAKFHLDATRNSIVGLYCKSDFEKCERKKLKDAGQPVPEKLLPNGKMLR